MPVPSSSHSPAADPCVGAGALDPANSCPTERPSPSFRPLSWQRRTVSPAYDKRPDGKRLHVGRIRVPVGHLPLRRSRTVMSTSPWSATPMPRTGCRRCRRSPSTRHWRITTYLTMSCTAADLPQKFPVDAGSAGVHRAGPARRPRQSREHVPTSSSSPTGPADPALGETLHRCEPREVHGRIPQVAGGVLRVGSARGRRSATPRSRSTEASTPYRTAWPCTPTIGPPAPVRGPCGCRPTPALLPRASSSTAASRSPT